MSKRIDNIFIDYKNGDFLVNGKEPDCLVRLTVKQPGGWDISQLMNYKNRSPIDMPVIADVTIDAAEILEAENLEKIRKMIRTEFNYAAQTQCKTEPVSVQDER